MIICSFFVIFSVEPSGLVCDISSFSDIEVSVVLGLSSLSSFNSLLFIGRNGDKDLDLIHFFFFGMRISGVIFTLFYPVKPIFPVDEDKEDLLEAVSI